MVSITTLNVWRENIVLQKLSFTSSGQSKGRTRTRSINHATIILQGFLLKTLGVFLNLAKRMSALTIVGQCWVKPLIPRKVCKCSTYSSLGTSRCKYTIYLLRNQLNQVGKFSINQQISRNLHKLSKFFVQIGYFIFRGHNINQYVYQRILQVLFFTNSNIGILEKIPNPKRDCIRFLKTTNYDLGGQCRTAYRLWSKSSLSDLF